VADDKALQISENALQDLVNQFSDPYAFLRELVQNSIDAGSNQVHVRFNFMPGPTAPNAEGVTVEHPGILTMHVDDTGEGMNRHIIDTQLTRLFSSSKEDDLTKIGKFGIGFVSVFALEPKAVVLDTGRDGESWRIFFKEDKSFDRIILDRPVEGTQVQLVLQVDSRKYAEIRQRSVATLIHWCKHAETEIFVDGEKINVEFGFDHPLAVMYESQGTTVSLMPTLDPHPLFGFYNRGLTLLEGTQDNGRFRPQATGYAYKIRSRYLEHTLTRDNVLRDKNYDKAMQVLSDAVDQKLIPRLVAAAIDEHERTDEVLGYLSFHLKKLNALKNVALLPTVSGKVLTIPEARKVISRQKELLYEGQLNRAVQSLLDENKEVFLWRGAEEQPGLGMLLKAVAEKTPLIRVNQVYAAPEILKDLPVAEQQLLDLSAELLHKAGSRYKQLVPGNLTYDGSGVADSLYVAQEVAGSLQRLDKRDGGGLLGFLFRRSGPKSLVVNLKHPLIEAHFEVDRGLRPLAAYLLAKAVTLDDGMAQDTEVKLLEAALEMERRKA
jgi:molecular chaperone HtpG